MTSFSLNVHNAPRRALVQGSGGSTWVTLEFPGITSEVTIFCPKDQAQAIADGVNKAIELAEAAKAKAEQDALDAAAQAKVDAANPPPAGGPDDWSF